MIVEVSGPSGVGKTTLILYLVYRASQEGYKTGAIHSENLINIPVSKRFSNIESFNFFMDLKIAPWALKGIFNHFKFMFFVARQLCAHFKLSTQNCYFEECVRKIGLFMFLSQKNLMTAYFCRRRDIS